MKTDSREFSERRQNILQWYSISYLCIVYNMYGYVHRVADVRDFMYMYKVTLHRVAAPGRCPHSRLRAAGGGQRAGLMRLITPNISLNDNRLRYDICTSLLNMLMYSI